LLRLLDGLPDRHFHSIRLDSPKKVDVDRLNGKLILNEEAASELEHHFKSRDHSPKLVCEIGSEIMTKIGIPDGYFQKILAQIIGCALTMNNYDLLEQMMTMVPEHITWDILAYNLARAYGRQENRAQLLEFLLHWLFLLVKQENSLSALTSKIIWRILNF